VRAIADAVLAIAPSVDVGGRVGAGGAHYALFTEVPAKTRGHAFGDRVLELLDGLGLTARVGIADDRFTAWVAAAYGPSGGEHRHGVDDGGVIAVPRGGSAAFLAPRPLSLLGISPEVQHMLEALGVTTLGQFAALPAPSVARPFEADYQALARGDGGTLLRPYRPDMPLSEQLVVRSGNVLDSSAGVSGPAAIAAVARRLALRLAGRGRAAGHLDVAVGGRELGVAPERALAEAEQLARALAPALVEPSAGAWLLRVTVTTEVAVSDSADGAQPAGGPEAFPHAQVEPHRLDPLALVLSTSASLDLRAERRVAHRRTRRGKVRRSRPALATQPRLFEHA
jgi:protein ImuB